MGAFGDFKVHEGPLGIPNQFVSDCMCSPSYVPDPSHLGLKNFDFSGYNKIYSLTLPILRLILPVWGHYGFWLMAFGRPMRGPWGTQTNVLFCMCTPNCYSYIPCHLAQTTYILVGKSRYNLTLPLPSHLRLNSLRFY